MILMADYSSLLPLSAGRVVGCASYRGDYIVIACERGIYKLWDDGANCPEIVLERRVEPAAEEG